MRLTLRTMLAYLDDLLESADAQELGSKIAESKFASSLVHRIRNCTRRLRLGSPPLEGRGLGRDANTVAEYLDNTLPQDRVPEFEKVCLESDVHLAEVASCHQILRMVLGEPREVEPALRERIFLLKHPSAARLASGPGASVPTAGDPTAGKKAPAGNGAGGKALAGAGSASPGKQAAEGDWSDPLGPQADGAGSLSAASTSDAVADGATGAREGRRTLEVPDYLRTPPNRTTRMVPILATLALTFLLATVALLAMGPLNRSHPIVGLFLGGGGESLPDAPESIDPAKVSADDGPEPSALETPIGGGEDAVRGGGQDTPQPTDSPPGESASTGVEREGEGTLPIEGPPGEQVPGPIPGPIPGPGALPGGGDLAAEPSRPAVEPARPRPPVQLPGEPAVLPPTSPPAGASVGPLPPAPSGDRPEGGEVVRMISESQPLFRSQTQDDAWVRVDPFAMLSAEDRFRVLPTFRPQLLMSSDFKITLAGESSFRFGADNLGSRRLEMDYGRALVLMVGKAGTTLPVVLGGRPGLITLRDLNSALAIEIRRYLPPGANPETDPAWIVTQLFATSGRFDWQEGTQLRPEPDMTVAAGQVVVMEADQAPRVELAGELPAWIDSRAALTPIDRKTSDAVEPLLVPDRPVMLTLMELTEHRQTDVRALAARCLSHVGHYDALVEQLGDARQKAYWDEIFYTLRESVARDPEEALQVRTALERKWPEQAGDLYRLLWGYSPMQLDAGSATQLVNWLESPVMVVRVLAFSNLKQITGGVTQLFRPEDGVAEERSKVLRWRDRLREGAIRYTVPPRPVPGRPPAGPPAGVAVDPANDLPVVPAAGPKTPASAPSADGTP